MKFGIESPAIVETFRKAPLVGPSAAALHDSWLNLKYELFWNVLRNPSSRRLFRSHPPSLGATARKVVDDLTRDGIASVSFDESVRDPELWQVLMKEAAAFVSNSRVREELAQRTEQIRTTSEADLQEKYLVNYFSGDGRPIIPISNPWLSFALRPEVLDVVNSYFGMWTKLIYFDFWHSVPTDPSVSLTRVPGWHRDPEDRRKLRIYLYFSPVDSGAMEYIPGTPMVGPLGNLWGWRGPVHRPPQPDDKELERLFPRSSWIRCTGFPGTLIFCDTSGIHRGTPCMAGSRILATWSFVTPASLHRRRFDVDWSLEDSELSDAARFAVA
jgi:hypothetical protein